MSVYPNDVLYTPCLTDMGLHDFFPAAFVRDACHPDLPTAFSKNPSSPRLPATLHV